MVFMHMRQDLVLAWRQLRRQPAFAAAVILTLALGIGANTAVFSLVHAVMLKSLPVADPASIYRLGDRDTCCVISGFQTHYSIFSSSLYQHLRDHTPEFAELAAAQADRNPVALRAGRAEFAESSLAEFVSGNYFTMFGVGAFAGRALSTDDDRPGAPAVAVMGYHVWEQRYGSDPALIGSTVTVSGVPVTIAGVAPPGFFGESLRAESPDLWLPLAAEPLLRGKSALIDHPDQHWLNVLGRLRPGADPAAVEARVNVELRNWWMARPIPPVVVDPAREVARQHVTLTQAGGGVGGMKNQYAEGLRILLATSGLVLLIACANIANLLLARGMSTRMQTSIRLALGAARRRLVRQALTESVALALAGGAAGVLVAWIAARALLSMAFSGAGFVPVDPRPSLPVLAFAMAVSAVTGILFGVLPAWSASRFDPIDALRGAGRTTRAQGRWQRPLVVAQAALSLVLLTGAGLLAESLGNLENQRYGFARENRVAVRVSPSFAGYSPERLFALYQRLRERLPGIPGVRSASYALYSPMRGGAWSSGIAVEGRAAEPGRSLSAMWNRVGPRFFETVGTPVIRGRALDESDVPTSRRVAVVNRAFAERFFPNQDPVGRSFSFAENRAAPYEVAGVVENARYANPREEPGPMFFLPYLQMLPSEWADSARARSNFVQDIVLRVDSGTRDLEAHVRRALEEVDPNLTVIRMATLEQQVQRNFTTERLIARLTGVFGILALALACLGLYGVTSYAVARRTNEIGIRAALGASRGKVIAMVLKGAMAQAICAVAIGVPAALAAGRLLASQVYGVQTSDPMTLAGAAAVLLVCAMAAGWIPARRASKVEPIEALRAE
jgi:predicted permease